MKGKKSSSKNWMQKAFKPSRRGLLTEKAHKAGCNRASAFARHVLKNKDKYDLRTRRQAQAALNAINARRKK